MTNIQNVDAGKKADFLEKDIVGGLIWKRHAILTVLKYYDDDFKPQTIALDFIHNTKYAQPLIDKKFREVQNPPSHADTIATKSIADELSKLAKLKEQGVITEEEFSQMKNNLMKGCSYSSYKDYDYTCFLSSPFSIVTVFIVPQFLLLTPKSDIFQKAWGV